MKFIGTKIITAEPMSRAAYVAFRGWQLPANEDGADAGYLVEYEPDGKPNVPGREGYVSWTPKAAFDNAYRPCDAMTFGLALEALKRGAKVARAGWNGKGMWLILVPGTPKAELREGTPYAKALGQSGRFCEILPHIDMWTVNAEGHRAMLPGWLASQSDMLAEDWLIVDVIETKSYADGTKAAGAAPLPDVSPSEQLRLQKHVDVARESGWTPASPAVHGLPPHQKRVIDEKRDLDERKEKLAAFFETPTFAQLDDSEQGRLHAQHAAMVDYSRVLGERIEAFTSLAEA